MEITVPHKKLELLHPGLFVFSLSSQRNYLSSILSVSIYCFSKNRRDTGSWHVFCALFGPISGDVFILDNKSAKQSHKVSIKYRQSDASSTEALTLYTYNRSEKFFNSCCTHTPCRHGMTKAEGKCCSLAFRNAMKKDVTQKVRPHACRSPTTFNHTFRSDVPIHQIKI